MRLTQRRRRYKINTAKRYHATTNHGLKDIEREVGNARAEEREKEEG